jgi:hypothetical protein
MEEIRNDAGTERVLSDSPVESAVTFEELSQILNQRFAVASPSLSREQGLLGTLDNFQAYLAETLNQGRLALQQWPTLGFLQHHAEVWEPVSLLEEAHRASKAMERIIFDGQTPALHKVWGFMARQILEGFENQLSQFDLRNLEAREAGGLVSVVSAVHMQLMEVRLKCELGITPDAQ